MNGRSKLAVPESIARTLGWEFYDATRLGNGDVSLGLWRGRQRVEVVVAVEHLNDPEFDLWEWLKPRAEQAWRRRWARRGLDGVSAVVRWSHGVVVAFDSDGRPIEGLHGPYEDIGAVLAERLPEDRWISAEFDPGTSPAPQAVEGPD